MLRTVILRHELPDGSWHFDWLLERRPGGDDERRLMAFRTTSRPDAGVAEGGAIAAQRIEDHRGLYLRYEGEIAGGRGRGRVERVAAGELAWVSVGDDRVIVDVAFRAEQGGGAARWEGERTGEGDLWTFRLLIRA